MRLTEAGFGDILFGKAGSYSLRGVHASATNVSIASAMPHVHGRSRKWNLLAF